MDGTAVRDDGAISVQEVGDGLLILDVRMDRIHQLNRTARFIWRQCERQATPHAMAAAMADEFAIDETTALADVKQALATFRSLGLLAGSEGA